MILKTDVVIYKINHKALLIITNTVLKIILLSNILILYTYFIYYSVVDIIVIHLKINEKDNNKKRKTGFGWQIQSRSLSRREHSVNKIIIAYAICYSQQVGKKNFPINYSVCNPKNFNIFLKMLSFFEKVDTLNLSTESSLSLWYCDITLYTLFNRI